MQPDKIRHFISRVSILLLLPLGVKAELPPFGPESFRAITFSGDCAKKTWSLTPENSLALIMAAGESACTVELPFHNPIPIETATSLGFTLRSTGKNPRYYIEFFDGTRATAMNPASTKRTRIPKRWTSTHVGFDQLRDGWAPQQITEMRITSLANGETGPDAAVLYIKNLQFAGDMLVDKPEEEVVVHMDEPAEALVMDDSGPQEGQTAPVPNRFKMPSISITLPKFSLPEISLPKISLPKISMPHFKFPSFSIPDVSLPAIPLASGPIETALALLAIAALTTYGLSRRKRSIPLSGSGFGPLFEINTRTWKSERDEDGVLHVGGFDKISLTDLKEVKSQGFNSIWLMGIWEIGGKVRDISKRYGSDFAGSPFAISDYAVSQELGSEESFKALVDRAHSIGLKVIVDFVPNHMGLDSIWLNQNPEYFIHKVLDEAEAALPDAELELRYPSHFVYRTPGYPEGGQRVPKKIMVAYGKDPYFYPWIDTAQLDYADPALRRKMTEVLSTMARMVDGVRCDMAMLVLREQIKIHRHPEMSWEVFNRWMPDEFWSEAIRSVKRVNPKFTFIAETYWAMEGHLQSLGFDFTYNKPLYEAICGAFHSGNAEGLLNFIRMLGTEFLSHGVHFLENHDEERAMNALGYDKQRGAAVMLCTLPGVALVHQGQMEGRRERLPVQRVVPLHDEPENNLLSDFYKKLLAATRTSLFQDGRLHVLYSNNASFITYARVEGDQKAVVIINTSGHFQKGTVSLMPSLRLKTGQPYQLTDLFYELKSGEIRRQPSVQPSYTYPAPQLINQGLYIELQPYDAHIFMVEPAGVQRLGAGLQKALKHLNEELPIPRVARRLLGHSLMRTSDLKH